MSQIRVSGGFKYYLLEKAKVPALLNAHVEITRGERVCLMGPSGSGKSTLLNVIGCIDRLSAGSVHINNEDVAGLSESKLSLFRNRTMGFIFQNFNLIPVMTVQENVEYPLLMQKIPRKVRRERVESLLDRVGLLDYRRRSPENLSGGQRQRVAIARALVNSPELIIADEPTAALDQKTGQSIMELMVELNTQMRTTLVFSTHDPLMARHASRTVRMADGVIHDDGAP